MNTSASCSLDFVFARLSTQTLNIRRGPSAYARCIMWDRANDSNKLGYTHADGHRVTLRSEDIAFHSNAVPYVSLMGDYFVEGGKLMRRIPDSAPHLIRDFSDMVLEPIPAPYSTDRNHPWHPLNRDVN